MSFRIRTLEEPRQTLVVASGELDAFAAPDLHAALTAASDAPAIVCSLAEADFLDSTALGVVVGAHRRAQASGRRFAVVLPRGHARRIFRLTALDEVIPVVES